GRVKSSTAPSASAINSYCDASYDSAEVGLEKSVIATDESGNDASRAIIFDSAFSCAKCGSGDDAATCSKPIRGLSPPSSSGTPLMRPIMTSYGAFVDPSGFLKIDVSAPSIHTSG